MIAKLKITCCILLVTAFAANITKANDAVTEKGSESYTKSTFDSPIAAQYNPLSMTNLSSEPLIANTAVNTPYSCTFSQNGWNAADWMFVGRSDMDSQNEWTQQDSYIENKSAASNSYTSMVYRHQRHGDFTASAEMAFTDRMAPAIVLAWKLGTNGQGQQEYLEHMEIVLFDQGINVWIHHTVDGKPVWIKTAYAKFPLEKNTTYQLQVMRKGQQLSVSVGDHIFGYLEDVLPDDLYVGVTAAEGINRLYDFSIR